MYIISMQFRKKKTVLQKAKTSKGANAQSKQIQTLARQVGNLKDASRELTLPTFYKCGYSSRTNSYPLIVPLTSGPSQTDAADTNNTPNDHMKWQQVFNYRNSGNDTQRKNIKLYSQYVDCVLEPGGEQDMLIHTIFLIKLRNEEGQAQKTYETTGEMQAMEEGDDFVTNEGRGGAQAFMNPLKYEIIKRWEKHTCGDKILESEDPGAGEIERSGGAIVNNAGAISRWTFKVNYGGRHIKCVGRDQSVNDLVYQDMNPQDKYFLVAFSDNSTADLENPLLSVSSIVKARLF